MKLSLNNFLTPAILAGGLGSRLGKVTKTTPKPLLKVNGEYFITYILEKISLAGFKEVYISICYLKESFEKLIGKKYKNIKIKYLYEEQALGTGGAVKNIFLNSNVENLMVFNGDSYCDFDLKLLINEFKIKRRNIILLCKVKRSGRFGNVIFDNNNKIINFLEKRKLSKGYINAGIYILNNTIMKIRKKKFSIEKEFFEKCNTHEIYAFLSDDSFIDIGTPKSLTASNDFFKKLL
tara:strand:- start:169 stop:876 length:708 start_codon:yes stop_codon:yes gene_type:complete